MRQAVAALGEDAASAVTFSLHVGDGRRMVNNANPISSFNATRRLVVDFRARVEVRRLGAADVIGSVEAIASGPPNQSEESAPRGRGAAPRGHRRGFGRGGGSFAPRLLTPVRSTLLVEVPVAAAGTVVKRLGTTAELYPELGEDDLVRLANSRERFLVIEPGVLAPLGLVRGDLVGVPGGATNASRAALLRAVAHGRKPLIAVDRGGQHYVLASSP